MAEANAQQEQYIAEELAKISADIVFNGASTWGSKFGIYYTWNDIDTAVFEPLRGRRLWETDASQFKSLADDAIAKVASYVTKRK